MAAYRQIHVSFWQDEFVLDLEPDEKYFYLYLMTNSKTTQSGIYELPKKVMVLEIGYPMDTLSILLKKFVKKGKILYSEETREIFLLNWLKYNSIKSPKVFSCVEKELKTVKDKRFLQIFANQCKQYAYPIPTVCKDYAEGYKPSLDGYGEEEEEEKEKKEEKEQQQQVGKIEEPKPKKEEEQKKEPKTNDVVEGSAIKFYQENGFGPITPHVGNKVFAWIDDLTEPLIIHAMEKAIEAGVLKWSYVETILKDWFNKKIKSIEEVAAIDMQRKQQQAPFKGRVVKDEKVPEWFEKSKSARKTGIYEEDEVTEDYMEAKRALEKKLGIKEDPNE